MPFKTRKEQIERDVMPRLTKRLKGRGVQLDATAQNYVREALESAAHVGGCGIRTHALEALKQPVHREAYSAIVAESVSEVLGYE